MNTKKRIFKWTSCIVAIAICCSAFITAFAGDGLKSGSSQLAKGLLNADFENGIDGWTATTAETSVQAKTDTDGNNYAKLSGGIEQSPFYFDNLRAGTQIYLIANFRADDSSSFEFSGSVLNSKSTTTGEFNGIDVLYESKGGTEWGVAISNPITVPDNSTVNNPDEYEGKIVYSAKIETASGKSVDIDNVKVVAKDAVGNYYDVTSVYAVPTDEEKLYGTTTDGLYSEKSGEQVNENAKAASIGSTFPNFDFSKGLQAWYLNSFTNDTSGYASAVATVDNGSVSIKTDPRGLGIRTMWFAPEVSAEKDTYLLFSYKNPTPKAQKVRIYIRDTGTNLSPAPENDKASDRLFGGFGASTTWQGRPVNLGNISGKEISIAFSASEGNQGNFSIKNIRLVYKNADGTYSDIYNGDIYSETGELYYGTKEKGIYSSRILDSAYQTNNNSSSYATSTHSIAEKYPNLDFSDGFKYWYVNRYTGQDGAAYTSDIAALQSDGSVKIKSNLGAAAGIRTMWFTPNIESGKTVAVVFKYKSSSKQILLTYTRDKNVLGDKATRARNELNISSDWSIKAVELEGITGKDISLSFYNGNTSDCFDVKDIHLVYVNDDNTYTDVYSGEVFDLNGFVLYGTKEDGIDSAGAKVNLSNYPAIDNLKNLDFSEGLKYWARNEGLTGKASDDVSGYENGRVTLRKLTTSDSSIDQSYISTVWVNLPGFVKDQEYKLYMKLGIQSPSEKSYAELLPDQGNGVNIQIKADEYVEKTTEPLILSTNASKIRVGLRNKCTDTTATYGDIDVYFADKGGIADTYVNFDGSPKSFGGYGDANADGKVDITDLVRMKKYTADSSTPIYLAAANTDKVVSEAITIKASDLTAMRKLLLGIQQ